MPFCEKCGNHLPEGANFCASCGAPVPPAPQQPNNPFQPDSFTPDNSQQTPYNTDYQPPKAPSQMPDSVKAFLDTEDHTAQYDPIDIQNSTVMAVLSYLGLLVLIPWFAAPNSPYTRFHAKQGMTLLIVDIAYSVLSFLLMLIKVPHTQYVMGIPITYSATPWYISAVVFLLSLPILALAVLGIVNAVRGKAKELPIIGKLNWIK